MSLSSKVVSGLLLFLRHGCSMHIKSKRLNMILESSKLNKSRFRDCPKS